jgi:putative transposase
MEILKAFKYRIYPNQSQKALLEKQFGAVRFVYNYFLDRCMKHYAETKKGLSYNETTKELALLKKKSEYIWLKEANSQSLQYGLKTLSMAYNNFFQKKAKFPRFKKKQMKQTFKVPQHFSIVEDAVVLPKIGAVYLILHRPIEGRLVNVTISKTSTGKYFASFQCKIEMAKPEYSGAIIGVDFGLNDFVTDSDGAKIKHPKNLKRSLRALKRLQKQVSKKKKGSANRAKAIKRLANKHEKVANQRSDFLHKLSYRMVIENQEIILEDLSLKNMLKNHCLAQALSDSGWAEFVRLLEYKGLWYGCNIAYIDRWVPSSKRCNECGWINKTLTLKDRSWKCLGCESIHDRDHNAARNILKIGRAGHARTVTTLGESMSDLACKAMDVQPRSFPL